MKSSQKQAMMIRLIAWILGGVTIGSVVFQTLVNVGILPPLPNIVKGGAALGGIIGYVIAKFT